MNTRRFEPHGPLALEPSAFGMMLMMGREPTVAERRGDVSIVPVRGALMHHRDPLCDSYDDIKSLVAQELAEKPRAVVLRIDSPGGLVAGCMTTARELRAMARAAGVPLIAYVDGSACSAAYALACAAERIVIAEAGMVGSIGVIAPLVDTTVQSAVAGVRVDLITSGARKADGHPQSKATEGALRSARETVEALADVFYAWVAESRGIGAVDVEALEAAQFTGAAAISHGLADAVSTFDDLLASLAGGPTPATAGSNGDDMDEEEKARAALQAIVDDEKSDDKAKARAKKALAAMDDDGDGEEPKSEGEPKDDEPEKDKPAASARAGAPNVRASTAGELAGKVSELEARLARTERERDTERRDALLASRPDLPAELRKVLSSKPFAEAKAIVDAMPRTAPKPAAAASVPVTRGEGQGEGSAARLAPEAKTALDAQMGLASAKPGVIEQGSKLVLGAMVPSTVKGA